MIALRGSAALLLSLALAAQPSSAMLSASAPAPIVNAPAGSLRGTTEGNLNVFRGIPFAEPPVGPLRWKPPVPKANWQGTRDATSFGAACWQPVSKLNTIYANDPFPMSEDCLTLNIWAPTKASKAPVLFWIYGGALWGGTSRDPLYDGR